MKIANSCSKSETFAAYLDKRKRINIGNNLVVFVLALCFNLVFEKAKRD